MVPPTTQTIGDIETTSMSQRIVERVADVTGTDPIELEPLYERVDPECLDSLFDETSPAADRHRGHLAFPMAGCRVVVWADGSIDVEPDTDTAKPLPGEDREQESSNPVKSSE